MKACTTYLTNLVIVKPVSMEGVASIHELPRRSVLGNQYSASCMTIRSALVEKPSHLVIKAIYIQAEVLKERAIKVPPALFEGSFARL